MEFVFGLRVARPSPTELADMPPHAHAHAADPVLAPPALAAARPPAPRPRPVAAPPAALVPPPTDPLAQEQRIEAALQALDQVRRQLERTRRSLDVFISQITHVPAPAPASYAPTPATVSRARTELGLPPAVPAPAGTPDALSGHVLGPSAGTPTPAHRVAGRRVADPAVRAQAGLPAAPDAAPHAPASGRRLGRPVGPRRATTPPEAGLVRPPGALADHLRPAAPTVEQRLDDA